MDRETNIKNAEEVQDTNSKLEAPAAEINKQSSSKIEVEFLSDISEETVGIKSKKVSGGSDSGLHGGDRLIRFSAVVHDEAHVRLSRPRDYVFVLPEGISEKVSNSDNIQEREKFSRRGQAIKEMLADNGGVLEAQKVKLVGADGKNPALVFWLDNRKFDGEYSVSLEEAEKQFAELLKRKGDLERCLQLRKELSPAQQVTSEPVKNEQQVFLEQLEGIPYAYIQRVLKNGEDILKIYRTYKTAARKGKLDSLTPEQRAQVPETIAVFDNVVLNIGRASRVKTARGIALQKRLNGEARPQGFEMEKITPVKWFEKIKDELAEMSIENVDKCAQDFEWSRAQKTEFYRLILSQLGHNLDTDKDINLVKKAVYGYKKDGFVSLPVNIERVAVIAALELAGDRQKQANMATAKPKRMLQYTGKVPFMVLHDANTNYDFLRITLEKKIKGEFKKKFFYIPLVTGSEVESYSQALEIENKVQKIFADQGSFNPQIEVSSGGGDNPVLKMSLGKRAEQASLEVNFRDVTERMNFQERLLAEVLRKPFFEHKRHRGDWDKYPEGQRRAIRRMQRIIANAGGPNYLQELVSNALEKEMEPLKKPLQRGPAQVIDVDQSGKVLGVGEKISFSEMTKSQIKSIPEEILVRVPGYSAAKSRYFREMSTQFVDLDPDELEQLNNAIEFFWNLRKVALFKTTPIGSYLQKHNLIEGKK